MYPDVWVGLANVAPYESTEYDFDGAYVNVLCLAEDFDDFNSKIRKALDNEKLMLINVEDAELFDKRSDKYYLNEDMLVLAEEARTKGIVCFSTFHAYESESEN